MSLLNPVDNESDPFTIDVSDANDGQPEKPVFVQVFDDVSAIVEAQFHKGKPDLSPGASTEDLDRLETFINEGIKHLSEQEYSATSFYPCPFSPREIALPQDFKTLYTLHDGHSQEDGIQFLYNSLFLSLAEISVAIEILYDRLSEFDYTEPIGTENQHFPTIFPNEPQPFGDNKPILASPLGVKQVVYNPYWIPFCCSSEEAECYYVIDLDPDLETGGTVGQIVKIPYFGTRHVVFPDLKTCFTKLPDYLRSGELQLRDLSLRAQIADTAANYCSIM